VRRIAAVRIDAIDSRRTDCTRLLSMTNAANTAEYDERATRRPQPDPTIPPGWSYNPSAWSQRLPLVGLALVGAIIASYLALHQYGLVGPVWEPFFGDGSERVLASPLSFALPISDATLGALGYIADAIAGAAGSPSRWRTKPWLVLLFGIFVGPLGAISVALVIAQPLLYDSWCTLCLASAAISLAMIGPAMDEALASLQHLGRVARTRERSLWRAFWGTAASETV
jgi:uncharacterized membrane protein